MWQTNAVSPGRLRRLAGARLTLISGRTHQGKLAAGQEFGENVPLYPCDVSNDEDQKFFQECVARRTTDLFCTGRVRTERSARRRLREHNAGRISDTMISALTAGCASALRLQLMTNGGSIVAMTYYGEESGAPLQRDGRKSLEVRRYSPTIWPESA